MTVPVVNQQSLTLFPQVRPSATPGLTMLQVNIPTSHVMPELVSRTFPAPSSLHRVHATVLQPVRGHVTLPNTFAAPIVTTTGIFTPVVPIQSGGTNFVAFQSLGNIFRFCKYSGYRCSIAGGLVLCLCSIGVQSWIP